MHKLVLRHKLLIHRYLATLRASFKHRLRPDETRHFILQTKRREGRFGRVGRVDRVGELNGRFCDRPLTLTIAGTPLRQTLDWISPSHPVT